MKNIMDPFTHVLLIDDDKDCHATNQETLRMANFTRIKTTLNGGHALVYLHQMNDLIKNSPLLILLDLEMPIMDGFEFLKNYNQTAEFHKENILIVVQGDNVSEESKEKLKLLGVEHIVSKPVKISDLQFILNGQVDVSSVTDEKDIEEVSDKEVSEIQVETMDTQRFKNRKFGKKKSRAAERR